MVVPLQPYVISSIFHKVVGKHTKGNGNEIVVVAISVEGRLVF